MLVMLFKLIIIFTFILKFILKNIYTLRLF